MKFALASHQEEALLKLQNGKILIGGVGSGKSITSLAYFTSINETKPIYVLTTAKKRNTGEWFEDAMKMSLRNEMIVDSWNNIKKYVDVENAFFVLDEQKLVGSGAWVDAFYKIAKNNKWILLSATPADTWMDLVPVFIANGFFRNKTEFNNMHVRFSRYAKFPKVEGYYETWALEDYRRRIYVEMPHIKRTVREEYEIEVSYDRDNEMRLWRDRWNFYEDKPVIDAGELMRLMRMNVNTHWSRYSQLKSIIKDHPRVIVFYNMNYELEILRQLSVELDIPVAEWNGHKHEKVPDTEEWVYIVQYQAGSEGWNCITTDTIVFYSLPYSYRNFEQAKGRIDRMNTKFTTLNYYIFKSKSIVDRGIWRSLKRKKNFQASAFGKKSWHPPKENPSWPEQQKSTL